MTFKVLFTPEVRDQLDSLERYIAAVGSPATAARYVDAIVTYCESFQTAPLRGTRRDDLFPGLRITSYRRRVVVAFLADEASETVSIVGIFYGGQDYEARWLDDSGAP
ncbi:type II toxin-antitoxin system RelE/ParE family toxin [Vineibacter terrae]|uniref:type II toxin-antitoxin system RelE/ParE family toxin n=1 Tax=Vineibacter terrae TaxID=2586908 RepID=UPI002E32829F|nr:type II toxin-antitoxin system RelE/ParE family toxin [Vineibacter terrae]HEX2887239.1 type II toxin-antitoxin system RelE/ParE family toxin [Vineibacter terrae]